MYKKSVQILFCTICTEFLLQHYNLYTSYIKTAVLFVLYTFRKPFSVYSFKLKQVKSTWFLRQNQTVRRVLLNKKNCWWSFFFFFIMSFLNHVRFPSIHRFFIDINDRCVSDFKRGSLNLYTSATVYFFLNLQHIS